MITGNVGDMYVEEKYNENGLQEISFLVGTVNHSTYLQDKYKIKIEFEGKIDIIKLEN